MFGMTIASVDFVCSNTNAIEYSMDVSIMAAIAVSVSVFTYFVAKGNMT